MPGSELDLTLNSALQHMFSTMEGDVGPWRPWSHNFMADVDLLSATPGEICILQPFRLQASAQPPSCIAVATSSSGECVSLSDAGIGRANGQW